MPQDIKTGSTYNTQVPSLTDTADIITAFTNYHYGITTGTAPLDGNITGGIAGWLKDLNTDKAPKENPTFTGTVILPATTSIGNVSSTEIGYVDGVTSSIQTQIDSKQNKAGAPVTVTANYTVLSSDTFITCNSSSTIILTLPSASANTGRVLVIKTINKGVNSSTSNILALSSNAQTNAILTATAGKWAQIVSNGTNWVIMSAN